MSTPLSRSSVIQLNILKALLLREIITRYGRNNIGFLWLFVEPMLFTIMISTMWYFFRMQAISGLNIIAFVITGYPIAMMWRNSSSRSRGAVSANQALLYHRNVRVLDLVYARVFLEMVGATTAQLFIVVLFIFFGLIPMPHDTFYMICAWFLMAWFSLGLGLIIFVLSSIYVIFNKIWGTLSFILLPLSGTFFWVDTFPINIQEKLLYIPPIHGTEMFRAGYFGNTVTTHENIGYLVLANIILLFIGLALVKTNEEKILEGSA